MTNSFHKKPEFYKYNQSFDLFGAPLHFYLDTDKNGEASQLFFEYEGSGELQKELENLCLSVNGSAFGQISHLKSESGFPLIPLLYRKFIMDIKADHISFAEQKGRDPQKLVCRCFGVYEEDVHELIGSGEEVLTIRDLGDHLNAGVGCGTCHHDLQVVLNPLLSKPVEESVREENPLWQKLDPQGLANEVFQILKSLNKGNEESYIFKLKGTRPGGVLLGCEVSSEISKEKATELVQNRVDKDLGKGLDCIVTIKPIS